jgi:hypothetical protein
MRLYAGRSPRGRKAVDKGRSPGVYLLLVAPHTGNAASQGGISLALMNLFPDEMLAVSRPMVDSSSKSYAVIIAHDDLKAPYKRLQAAHAGLSNAAQPKADRIQEIILAQAKLDVRHDAIIRGLWGFFSALAELVGGDGAASLLALRDLLIPDGLLSQKKTYGGQAGQATQLALRMTPDIRKRTDAFLIGEGAAARTLTSYLEEWISLGEQLNTYEVERGTLEIEPSVGASLHNARLDWVRAMNAMVANAEMAGPTPADMAVLFGGLQSAERKADERAREAKAKVAAEAKAALEKAAADKAAADKAGSDGEGSGNE